CRRKQVRGRVAEDFERLGVVAGEDGELGVALEWPGEIHELAGAVSDRGDARYQGLLGKSRGGFLRDLLRRRAAGHLDRLLVRQGNLNAYHARLVALGVNFNVAIIHLTQANLSLASLPRPWAQARLAHRLAPAREYSARRCGPRAQRARTT